MYLEFSSIIFYLDANFDQNGVRKKCAPSFEIHNLKKVSFPRILLKFFYGGSSDCNNTIFSGSQRVGVLFCQQI
jgi:hypothetical protein